MFAKIVSRLLLITAAIIPALSTAAPLECPAQSPFICIASFVPGQPGSSDDVDYDVPGQILDLTAEEFSFIFTLPVGLDPVTPGIRSVILLNRPGGPSGPVGQPSDFVTLTAFDPIPELGGLTQTFELVFQSENSAGFDVNVLAVQATGAPELFSTGAFQDLSSLLQTEGVVTIWVGSEGFTPTPIPEPGTCALLSAGLCMIVVRRLRRVQ